MQFFTLASSKMDVFETYFSDTVITQNDHLSYVKHFVGRIYVVFLPYFGCVLLGVDSLRGGLAEGNRLFSGSDSMGFVWGGVGQALVQFMHFSAIFRMLAVSATSVTRGVSGDV